MERFLQRWQLRTAPVLTAAGVFAFLTFWLVFRLSSVTSGNAAGFEQQTILHSRGWHALLNDPLNLPQTGLLRLVTYASHSLFSHRLVGAALGLAACGLFYLIAYKWTGYRLAALGTLLFGTSSYLLHTARLVDTRVLEMLVCLGLVALFCWTYRNPAKHVFWWWAFAVPLMLYVPGAVCFVVIALWLCRRQLREVLLGPTKLQKAVAAALVLVLLAPLLHFLAVITIKDHSFTQFAAWLGIVVPHGLSSVLDYLKRFAYVPVHLFVHGQGATSPANGLGNLPALDAVADSMALLGLYVHISRFRDARWRFNIALLATGWVIISLGVMSRAFLMPLLYLLAIVGLAYMLSEWYKVFPRNPIARGAGLGLIVLVVTASCLYNLRSYFVAWPHNPATIQAVNCPQALPRPSSCPQTSF